MGLSSHELFGLWIRRFSSHNLTFCASSFAASRHMMQFNGKAIPVVSRLEQFTDCGSSSPQPLHLFFSSLWSYFRKEHCSILHREEGMSAGNSYCRSPDRTKGSNARSKTKNENTLAYAERYGVCFYIVRVRCKNRNVVFTSRVYLISYSCLFSLYGYNLQTFTAHVLQGY